jgi:hypothetical protein
MANHVLRPQLLSAMQLFRVGVVGIDKPCTVLQPCAVSQLPKRVVLLLQKRKASRRFQ